MGNSISSTQNLIVSLKGEDVTCFIIYVTHIPIFLSSTEESKSCPAAISSTTLLMPECREGSILNAFPYLGINMWT